MEISALQHAAERLAGDLRGTLWRLPVEVWCPQCEATRRRAGDVVVGVSEDGVRWWQVSFWLDGPPPAEQLALAARELVELIYERFAGWPISARRGWLTAVLERDDVWWTADDGVVARVGELSTVDVVLASLIHWEPGEPNWPQVGPAAS
jgi:hypothetical protein